MLIDRIQTDVVTTTLYASTRCLGAAYAAYVAYTVNIHSCYSLYAIKGQNWLLTLLCVVCQNLLIAYFMFIIVIYCGYIACVFLVKNSTLHEQNNTAWTKVEQTMNVVINVL